MTYTRVALFEGGVEEYEPTDFASEEEALADTTTMLEGMLESVLDVMTDLGSGDGGVTRMRLDKLHSLAGDPEKQGWYAHYLYSTCYGVVYREPFGRG